MAADGAIESLASYQSVFTQLETHEAFFNRLQTQERSRI